MPSTLLKWQIKVNFPTESWGPHPSSDSGCVQTDATLLTNISHYCWLLHVASVCTPCCMLLDVVAFCFTKFETGQTFQPTTPNISFVPWSPKRSSTMLDPFAQLFQHCWGRARSLRLYAWFTKGCILPSVRTPLPTRTQQLPTLLAQQFWELLSPFARSVREEIEFALVFTFSKQRRKRKFTIVFAQVVKKSALDLQNVVFHLLIGLIAVTVAFVVAPRIYRCA